MRKITVTVCTLALGLTWAVTPALAQTKDDSAKGKMERAKDTTKEKTENAIDKTKEKTGEAVDKTKETAGETKDKIRNAVTGSKGSDDVRQAQQVLMDKGFNPGPIDGKMGPQTKAALRDYQTKENLKVTGRLDHETKMRLTGGASAKTSKVESGTPAPAASPATEAEGKTQKK